MTELNCAALNKIQTRDVHKIRKLLLASFRMEDLGGLDGEGGKINCCQVGLFSGRPDLSGRKQESESSSISEFDCVAKRSKTFGIIPILSRASSEVQLPSGFVRVVLAMLAQDSFLHSSTQSEKNLLIGWFSRRPAVRTKNELGIGVEVDGTTNAAQRIEELRNSGSFGLRERRGTTIHIGGRDSRASLSSPVIIPVLLRSTPKEPPVLARRFFLHSLLLVHA